MLSYQVSTFTSMPSANDLRKGRVIRYNNEPNLILEVMHRTPGNLRAFVQVKMRNLRNGRSADVRFSSTESVEVLQTDTRDVEFSYQDRDVFAFMDMETYETIELNESVVGDASKFMAPNCQVKLLFVDDQPVQVELPGTVELIVTEAPEAVKGDSATGATKTVTLETGLRVNTPLFIKEGEKLRISTVEGTYQGRA